MLVKFNPGGFEFCVIIERVHRLVSAIAALLKPAKRHGHIAAEIIIDAHCSNSHCRGDFVRGIDVITPNGTGETID